MRVVETEHVVVQRRRLRRRVGHGDGRADLVGGLALGHGAPGEDAEAAAGDGTRREHHGTVIVGQRCSEHGERRRASRSIGAAGHRATAPKVGVEVELALLRTKFDSSQQRLMLTRMLRCRAAPSAFGPCNMRALLFAAFFAGAAEAEDFWGQDVDATRTTSTCLNLMSYSYLEVYDDDQFQTSGSCAVSFYIHSDPEDDWGYNSPGCYGHSPDPAPRPGPRRRPRAASPPGARMLFFSAPASDNNVESPGSGSPASRAAAGGRRRRP